MSTMSTLTNESFIRSDLWSKQLQDQTMDDLMGMRFVKVISDFPDGTTFHYPSLGEAETFDFVEGQAVRYSALDDGDFTFSYDQYKGSATSISEKYKRDSYYSDAIVSAFLPRQHRALMEAVETRILSRGPSGQTASDLNTINEADHRWVAGGVSNRITLEDFARAWYALMKANFTTDLVAIVDPTVAYTLQTQANVVNQLSPQPMWENVVKSGMVTGMKFRFNIFGFDVYVSNYLPRGSSETIDGRVGTSLVSNQFFSATPGDFLPIIGGFRQMPTVQSKFNMDLQQTDYLTICEYGFKLYRRENMVVVLSNTDIF